MKHLIHIPISLILAFIAVSCREQTSRVEDPKPERFQNPYSQVGEIHNAGIDYTFSYLKANKARLVTKPALLDVAHEAVASFLPGTTVVSNDILSSQIGSIVKRGNSSLLKSMLSKASSDSLFLILGYNEKQIEFLNRLFNLGEDSLSIDTAKDSISNINTDAFAILGPDDSRPILMASSVMESSFEYWLTHLKEWEEFFASLWGPKLHKRTEMWEPDWIAIGKADAEGAAAGGIACIFSTVAYLPCVAEAAVFASVANATWQLYNYWFPE
jgi:hypothetical protein